jgi:hypothetical protein
VRSWLGVLAFGVFVGITSLLGSPRYQGSVRMALSIVSGAALMFALRTMTAEKR